MMVKRPQNNHEKPNQSEIKIAGSFKKVMQAFHRIQIQQNKRKIKKLQNQDKFRKYEKPKLNKYTKKDFR